MRLLWRAALATALCVWMPASAPSQQPARVASPAAATTPAADSMLEARTRAVASELRCPVCQGLSIADSPSDLSTQMKDLVREQLRAGKTPDEVKRYFIDKYGEWILLAPKPSGANLLVYLLPVGAVIGGLVLVWSVVRRWTTSDAVASTIVIEDADQV
jgi:cytochrome c-type biogenesis protein CcmH